MKSCRFTLAVVLLFGLTVSGQQPSMRFDRVQLLEETSETSANVSLGDLNGDGHLDLMLAKGRHWPLVDQVLLNDGKGNILAKPLGTADRTYAGLLVDLDGDRDLDVVVSNDDPDPKRVYLNDGRANFTPGSMFGKPEWPTRNVSVADLDGDALPDIIVANYVQRPNGKFGDRLPLGNHTAAPYALAVADLNRDAKVDIIVGNVEARSVVYFNDNGRTFHPLEFGDNKGTAYGIATGDVDEDGVMDIAVARSEAPNVLYFGSR